MIDTHAHLQFDQFREDLPQVLSRANEAGVTTIITVGTEPATNREAVSLAVKYPQVYASVGIHPHEAARFPEKVVGDLKDLAGLEKVVAIGEFGLDYHYDHSPPEVQRDRFRQQIRLAHEVKLPLILHCRDAFDDCFRILDEEEGWKRGGVFHCFTGSLQIAEKIIEKGFYVSFSGIVTFKKSKELQEVARGLSADRFLIETDCPYLAPEPFRGKRNEPAYVRQVAQTVADLRGTTLEEVQRITSENARTLFALRG